MSLILKYDLGNPHRLPVGYTPLAYIESTGTQYIDTNITMNNTVKIYCKMQAITTGGLFYGTGNGGSTSLTAWAADGGMNWRYGGLAASPIPTIKSTEVCEILHSSSSANVNGTNFTYSGTPSFDSWHIYIFDSPNDSSTASAVRCYFFKIWKDNVLVNDLIPAKNSSGVVGLFDCVSQTFKTNAGTGTFIAGPEVVVLPYEYLLVEYLHAAGSQWFDTGIKIFHKTTYSTFEISSLFSVDSIHNYDQLWGTPGDANRYEQWINSSGVFNNRLANTYSTHSSMTANTMINYTCTGNVSNSLFVTIVNGSSVTKSYSPEDWNYNLYFLKSDYYFTGKVFNFKMTGNGTLIRNFIPCYRRSDLKPGMYDTVNNVFYTNAGSGEFILGPVVEESSRLLEYNNAGSNYIGKPTNVHHSISNPSSTLINLGSGNFNTNSWIKLPRLQNLVNGSISFWLKVNTLKNVVIVGNEDELYYLGATRNGTGAWYHHNCGTITTYVDGVVKTTPTADTNWHHIVFTGVNLSTWTTAYLNKYISESSGWNVNGCYYDFRIYDNVLTADEVLNIYKKGV